MQNPGCSYQRRGCRVFTAKTEILGKPLSGWRLQLYTVIFEADTRAGRWFDKCLIATILASVAVVVADSVHSIAARYHSTFTLLEWFFTLIFTVEYAARLACVRHPLKYALSFCWAITTMTTVGFGDMTPKTDLGRLIAAAMLLLGWGTLAVLTGHGPTICTVPDASCVCQPGRLH